MRMFALVSVALVLGPATTFAADPNVVTSVEVTERGSSVDVTVRGSKPPSFTTFSLVDPPRFVIDLSEATFDGVKRKVGGVGAVKEVNAIAFGEGVHATARLTVTFLGDVEPPDVQAAGNVLVVRVGPRPGTAVAAASPPEPAPVAAGSPPSAPPTPVAAAPAVAPAAPAVPAVTAASAAAVAAAAADAEQARAMQQAKEAEAKALADAKAAAEAQAAAEARAQAQAAPALAVAPAAPAPAPAAPARAPAAAPAPPNQVEFVGFKQTAQGSRVFVRTRTAPRFSVSEPRENVVRVEFPNTRVPLRNDLNFLDTSFFTTAVAKVTPIRAGSSYVIEIQLRERVAWQQRLDGDTLSLDFDRPARPAASTAPAAPAPPAAPAK